MKTPSPWGEGTVRESVATHFSGDQQSQQSQQSQFMLVAKLIL